MNTNIKRYTLRMEEGLHTDLTKDAKENNRTMHGQILHIIYEYFKNKKAEEQSPNLVPSASSNH